MVTEEALVFATNMLKLELSLEKRQWLMQAYLELKSYPDALPALKSLREAGNTPGVPVQPDSVHA